jgi:polyisoprenoid-binding protein YceI
METKIWTIDAAHSGINFSIRHMVIAKVRGRFGSFGGTARLEPEDLTRSSVEVTIDAASIDTGVADRDAHLRSADFLDVARFPKLAFKSTKVERTSGDRYRVHGALTIRDVTREVVLDVVDAGRTKDPWGNQRAAFSATASLDRGDFGLKWNQALEAGGLLVGERVDVEIELEAVEAPASQAA